MCMGMGINLYPWVLKWVGIEGFYGYGFGQKEVVPAHTLPIAIPTRGVAVDLLQMAKESWPVVRSHRIRRSV